MSDYEKLIFDLRDHQMGGRRQECEDAADAIEKLLAERADHDVALMAQVRETVKLREQLAPILGALIEPEFRKALLWLLWHHQGGSSRVGQPIRVLLGVGRHDHLTDDQLSAAKSFAAPVATPAPVAQKVPEALAHIATLAHLGGIEGDAVDVLVAIRKLSLPWYEGSGTSREIERRVTRAMIAAAKAQEVK